MSHFICDESMVYFSALIHLRFIQVLTCHISPLKSKWKMIFLTSREYFRANLNGTRSWGLIFVVSFSPPNDWCLPQPSGGNSNFSAQSCCRSSPAVGAAFFWGSPCTVSSLLFLVFWGLALWNSTGEMFLMWCICVSCH